MTNHLAAELRQILDQLDVAGFAQTRVREDLNRLTEHIERLGDEPAEVDASTELTANFGLEPEQEIRADALTAAERLLAPALGTMSWTGIEMNLPGIADAWLTLANRGAGYVDTGQQRP